MYIRQKRANKTHTSHLFQSRAGQSRALAKVRAWINSSLGAALTISLLVFATTYALRQQGILQPLELVAYDWMIRTSAKQPAPPRVTVLTITENDIQTLGRWPIPNGTLAEALQRLLEHQPRAIGIDIYLDVPVEPGREKLEAVLTGNPQVVAATKFPRAGGLGVPPPSVLEGSEQLGFTDFIVDAGGIVRRGLLFLDDGQSFAMSLGLRTALLYLQPEGIAPQADPQIPEHIRLGEVTIPPFEASDGSYIDADAAGYQFLLDYRDRPGSIPTISLLKVLAADFDPALIQDRVILIGVAADSVKDIFYTPFSREDTDSRVIPGVLLHGDVVNQLLRFALDGDHPIHTLSDREEALWLLLWSLLGAALGLLVRAPARFAASGLLGLAVLYGAAHAAFLSGWWIPLVPPAVAWMLSATIITAHKSYAEMQERNNLMNIFSRHISKQLAVDIWENRDEFLTGGHPLPQKLTATSFFSDVVSFSTISEQLEPQPLMDWLNSYMSTMTPVINEHNGVILRFIGDAIMAVFGVPIPRETEEEIDRDAINAVACALAMQDALIRHNRRLEAEHKPLVAMRVGIFTGQMVAGSIGDAERLEYNVHGDTVNTAARLEGYKKETYKADPFVNPCRIYIGEPTYARLGGRFRTEYIGEARLKGKDQITRIYQVVGRQDAAGTGSEKTADVDRKTVSG